MNKTGLVTKELKKTLKAATSISIRLSKESAEITCSKAIHHKNDGFVGNLESKHNGFRASLPSGYGTAYFSDPISRHNQGNYAALNLIIRVDDELIFRVVDNQNGYLKMAEIPCASWNKDNSESYITADGNGEGEGETPQDYHHHPDYLGLHNDTLFVTVMRKGRMIISDFEIESSCTPDNSARRLQK